MRALRVKINDGAPVTAGADDLGVLNLIVSCVGPLGPSAVCPPSTNVERLKVNLGGLTSRGSDARNEHLDWLSDVPVNIGDTITVEILETDSPDPIGHAEEVKRRESDARQYYEHCKETYLKLRDHYEPEA
jgi:hypothetical protein